MIANVLYLTSAQDLRNWHNHYVCSKRKERLLRTLIYIFVVTPA
jgi:hypothetical protein